MLFILNLYEIFCFKSASYIKGANSPLEKPKSLFSRKSEDAIQSFYLK